MSTAEKIQEISQKQRAEMERFQPMWKIVLNQFFEHRMAVVGLSIISIFILIAIMAPVIASVTGLDPERQNALNRYKPINSYLTVSTDERESKISAFLREQPEEAAALQAELVAKNLMQPARPEDALYEFISMEPKEGLKILSQVKSSTSDKLALTVKNFESHHWLGTDELGRDVFIRLVYGTRVSMGVGILVALTSSLIGLLIGAIAGYYGGMVDTILMRITDSLLSLPILPIQIVIAAIDLNKIPGLSMLVGSQNQSLYKLVFILVLFSWMTVALLVRGSILSLREREFILAAKTMGATDTTIIFRHMFPNVVAPMLVSVTLGVGESILWEAALSFLGLGIQQPTPSWGNMLFNAQDLMTEAPFLAILPGLLIFATTISFNYLGDGLQDAIDPKAIRR
jgi:peptide/nickel transport system permease protein